MKRIIAAVLIFVLMLGACSNWSVEIKEPESGAQGSSAILSESVPESVSESEDTSSYHPEDAAKFDGSSALHLEDFVIIGISRFGPGSMDYQFRFTDEQFAEFQKLLCVDDWKIAEDYPPTEGFGTCMATTGDNSRTIVIQSFVGVTESLVLVTGEPGGAFWAPASVFEDYSAFIRPFLEKVDDDDAKRVYDAAPDPTAKEQEISLKVYNYANFSSADFDPLSDSTGEVKISAAVPEKLNIKYTDSSADFSPAGEGYYFSLTALDSEAYDLARKAAGIGGNAIDIMNVSDIVGLPGVSNSIIYPGLGRTVDYYIDFETWTLFVSCKKPAGAEILNAAESFIASIKEIR